MPDAPWGGYNGGVDWSRRGVYWVAFRRVWIVMRLLGSMLELGNSMGLILEARSSLFFFSLPSL